MTTETQNTPKRPSHTIYIVTGEGDKAIWKPIGAAFAHGDGLGYNLLPDAIPLNGRLVMRPTKAKAKSELQLALEQVE